MNQYDNEKFYADYALTERSKHGLDGAGEWRQFKRLLPKFEGKNVLDLGCGYGWHCKYAADDGAANVLGIDSSEKMIETARLKNAHPVITYRVCGIDEFRYPKNRYDCIISNLALHYVSDLQSVYAKVYYSMKTGGVFVFNIEHPVFTAGVNQQWIYSSDGTPLYWPVDDYFYSGRRLTRFLGNDIEKYHRTLTEILSGLLNCGFRLDAVEEAVPCEEQRNLPEMKAEMRRPQMLLVKAVKQ